MKCVEGGGGQMCMGFNVLSYSFIECIFMQCTYFC